MSELEVHLEAQPLGHVHRHAGRGGERISFRYDPAWLSRPDRFSIDPELHLDLAHKAGIRTPEANLLKVRGKSVLFGLSSAHAESVVLEVQRAALQWEAVAKNAGATKREVARMRSAFLPSA